VQREGEALHLIAQRLTNLSGMLDELMVTSSVFHWARVFAERARMTGTAPGGQAIGYRPQSIMAKCKMAILKRQFTDALRD
jgi:hypothetical protein